MSIEVPNSCPYYRWNPKLNKVIDCGGTVIVETGYSYGVCQSCKKEVPLILEM